MRGAVPHCKAFRRFPAAEPARPPWSGAPPEPPKAGAELKERLAVRPGLR
jgi:hypothetical protein